MNKRPPICSKDTMRYIFLMIILYFAFKAAGNLIEAVSDDGRPDRRLDNGRYADADIEEATWEDIE